MAVVRDVRAALRRGPLRTLPRRALLRARYGPSRPDPAVVEARALAELARAERAPLRDGPATADGPLDVAIVVPYFTRGSGGHTTIANIVRALERRGHRCSFWLDDPGGRLPDRAAAARDFAAWFGPFAAPVHADTRAWRGADVVLATGYQTVLRARTLPDCGARAYLVQDHEPEFFATSAERLDAERSYRHELHAITAGRWLAQVMERGYGLRATPFDLAVDASVYRPLADVERERDTVVFYARAVTPRRAVPIGLAALSELRRRRPQTRVVLFGQSPAPRVDFPAEDAGVVGGEELARLYARATVGMCLSLTNYSLVPQEMLACGLPCVEVDMPSVREAFGSDGPVALAEPDPFSLADVLERLLADPGEREWRAREGRALVAPRTWDAAGAQVEAGLRAALTSRSG
jgi:glycosyltransferase involved in cell wall biosynthesis